VHPFGTLLCLEAPFSVVTAEFDRVEEDLKLVAEDPSVVAHPRRILGVGLIVALCYVLTIDDPHSQTVQPRCDHVVRM